MFGKSSRIKNINSILRNSLQLVKKIRKGVADDMFGHFQDNSEFFKMWTKIFSYIPNKVVFV